MMTPPPTLTHLSREVDGEQAVLSAVQFGEGRLGHGGLARANWSHQQHWPTHPHQVLDQKVVAKGVYGRDYDLVEWSAEWGREGGKEQSCPHSLCCHSCLFE